MKKNKNFKTSKIIKLSLKNLKKVHIKNKIINNLLINGKKNINEKTALKSLKQLQKCSTKQAKKLIQLSIISSLPIFKIQKIKNKKAKKKKQKNQGNSLFYT